MIERDGSISEKILSYTHLSKSRYTDMDNKDAKKSVEIMIKSCRRYLDFMERYIIDAVGAHNRSQERF